MTMAECPLCTRIKNKTNVICESERVVVLVPDAPAAPGHLWIAPKEHVPILEQCPDYIVGELFEIANKASIAVLESVGATGTNLFVANGLPAGQFMPHILVHVLPRKERDGILLEWNPKELSEDEMAAVEMKLKDEAGNIGPFETEPKKKPVEPPSAPKKRDPREFDSILKALRRIP